MRILVADFSEARQKFFMKKFPGLGYCVVQAFSYEEAALEIDASPNVYGAMFLEHDLEEGGWSDPQWTSVKTGSDLATRLAYTADPKKCVGMTVYCHSMNKPGRDNMVKILRKAGFNAVSAPFVDMELD